MIVSLICSYFLTSIFFHEEIIFNEEVTKVTEGITRLISHSEPENLHEIISFLKDFNIEAVLLNEEGDRLLAGEEQIVIPEEKYKEIIRDGRQAPIILPYFQGEATRLIGTPITLGDETFALFLLMNNENEANALKKVTLFALIFVLIIGSLLILLASRYLVNPIKAVTHAAKKMATGNFSVRLSSKKNKDEIGELITSFNYMAKELGEIDKMREDFVSNVSHEIQSPLTSIKGFTKALKDDVIPKENQKEYLDIIYQESDRLSRLGENLLQLASLDSEHHPYFPINYRLDEQIRRTVLLTEPQWKMKNLKVNLDLHSQEVIADKDLLEQVWLNLITNAIKYSDENKSIYIYMENKLGYVVVYIKDLGKGIPKESLPYLFDRFYKVDKARSTSIKGNGLGLSIVKKILDIHGFLIDVQSVEGEGSIFRVTIPQREHMDDDREKTLT